MKIETFEDNPIYVEMMADWNRLQQAADINGDGQISLDEWLAHAYTRITDADWHECCQKEADAVFKAFDKNNDGVLNRDEYSTYLKAGGVKDEEIEFTCSKLNLEGENTLSKAQLIQYLDEFHKGEEPNLTGNYMFGSF